MIYILCMIAGAAIFTGGFFVGKSIARPIETNPPPQKAEPEMSESLAKQYANWLNYDGRPQV